VKGIGKKESGTFIEIVRSYFLAAGGILFPSKNPIGSRDSIRSKIILTIAVSGIDKNIPGIPQIAPPISTTIIEIKA
jgi:hypothetical protein